MDASIVILNEDVLEHTATEEEVRSFASKIGMQFPEDEEFLSIARAGVRARLPDEWKPCQVSGESDMFYFNFSTGQSQWEHPCIQIHKDKFAAAKAAANVATAKPLSDITPSCSGNGNSNVNINAGNASTLKVTKTRVVDNGGASPMTATVPVVPVEVVNAEVVAESNDAAISAAVAKAVNDCEERMAQQIKRLREDNEHMKRKHRSATKRLQKEHDATIDSVMAKLRKLQQDVVAADNKEQTTRRRLEKENAQHARKLQEANSQLKHLAQRLADAEARSDDSQKRESEATSSARRANEELLSTKSQLQTVQATVADLKNKYSQFEAHQHASTEDAKIVEDLQSKLAASQQQLADTMQLKEMVAQNLRAMTSRHCCIEKLLLQERGANQRLKEARSRRRRQLDLARKNLANKDLRIDGLLRDIGTLKNNKKDLLRALGLGNVADKRHLEQVESVRILLASHKATAQECADALGDVARQSEEVDHLKSDITVLCSQLAESREKCTAVERSAEAKIAALNSAIESARKEFEAEAEARQSASHTAMQAVAKQAKAALAQESNLAEAASERALMHEQDEHKLKSQLEAHLEVHRATMVRLEQLEADKLEAEQRAAKSRAAVKSLEDTVAQMKHGQSSAERLREELQLNLEQVTTQFKIESNALQEQSAHLQREQSRSKQAFAEHEAYVQSSTSLRDQLKSELSAEANRNAGLMKQVSSTAAAHQSEVDKSNSLATQLAAARSQLAQAEEAAARETLELQREAAALKVTMTACRDAGAQQVEELAAQLAAAEKLREEAAAEHTAAVARQQQDAIRIDGAQQRCLDLEHKCASLQEALSAAEQAMQKRKVELETLRSEMSEMGDERNGAATSTPVQPTPPPKSLKQISDWRSQVDIERNLVDRARQYLSAQRKVLKEEQAKTKAESQAWKKARDQLKHLQQSRQQSAVQETIRVEYQGQKMSSKELAGVREILNQQRQQLNSAIRSLHQAEQNLSEREARVESAEVAVRALEKGIGASKRSPDSIVDTAVGIMQRLMPGTPFSSLSDSPVSQTVRKLHQTRHMFVHELSSAHNDDMATPVKTVGVAREHSGPQGLFYFQQRLEKFADKNTFGAILHQQHSSWLRDVQQWL